MRKLPKTVDYAAGDEKIQAMIEDAIESRRASGDLRRFAQGYK